ncbi:DUF1513 domain-containing protein [Pseudomonas sp. RIT-PI-S]|uniref:DUF1513 domain-containing protein n=1 Tax=Pseudomonas sp. RIT-PI-S TaxID=3035295 RepID=UPI0021D9AD4E|nr:DUF1513 domain-containing protein [Pseudomonas sp. RIT-PI-S]
MWPRPLSAFANLISGAFNLGAWRLSNGRKGNVLLLSARDDADGGHYAVGYRLDGTQAFSTQVAQRCHAIVEHPLLPLALFVARRPGTESYLLDLRDGRLLQTVRSEPDRHFYGHAIIHGAGEWLYATENDTRDPGRGLLGIYRFVGERLERTGELATHGIGPHEVAWLPDGETLAVANGGIRTEAESRVEMNLDAMEPSLVLLRRDGSLISKETLDQPMNSIRHLAVAADGTLAACQQFMGSGGEVAQLLAIKRPGAAFCPFPVSEAQLLSMGNYTASVAINDELRLVAVTAPRANRFFVWDLDSAEVKVDAPMPDCAGVAAVQGGFVVTSGQGRCRYYRAQAGQWLGTPMDLPPGLWDNHLHVA